METQNEKRKYQRLPLKLAVFCHRVGLSAGELYTGTTVNVGPGGVLAEVNSRGRGGLDEGELLSIEMSVPPTKGLLEYGGRFSSYVRVLRVEKAPLNITTRNGPAVQTLALEFCESPRLNVQTV